ncbi:myosin heavy chain, skeletal muscle, adult isoform X2 [Cryptotermes secundus]|uniref:myosin heavy chain, skeletal muscle, adult isoform X2 n=1 Tax=Cryptotermes secundus TaxID=105785 RepID=UPI001454DDDD|nr:myosin heavy chain, skeletal muscle, adult isoform X2 [Cryptotermes secundus]
MKKISRGAIGEGLDGEDFQRDLDKHISKIKHIEDQIRESHNKMECLKWKVEEATRAMERSDALKEHLEEKSRLSSMKRGAIGEKFDGEESQRDLEKCFWKIKHLEDQIRESNNKMECMKWKAEEVARAMDRSDVLKEHLEEKSRLSSMKMEQMKAELQHAKCAVELLYSKVQHLDDQVQTMKGKNEYVRSTTDARIKCLEKELDESSKKAMERECGNAVNPVQDSDVHTEHLEHILGLSSNKAEDMEGKINHAEFALEQYHAKKRHLADELKEYKQKLVAAHLFQEHQAAVALLEKEKLLKKIEIMKQGDLRVHNYYTKEIEELKKKKKKEEDREASKKKLLNCIKKVMPFRARTSKSPVPEILSKEKNKSLKSDLRSARKRQSCKLCA